MSGIVIHDKRCEISAMPAAVEVSLPYAAGTTMVLSPSGIASSHMMQSAMPGTDMGRKARTAIPIRGSTIRRTIDTAYMDAFLNVDLRSIFAMVIPVSIIASGDIHAPRESMALFANVGALILRSPSIIPMNIAINIGFMKFFRLASIREPVAFTGMRSEGTPQT